MGFVSKRSVPSSSMFVGESVEGDGLGVAMYDVSSSGPGGVAESGELRPSSGGVELGVCFKL